MKYYVYILLCEDDSYYTGYAQDVEVRFRQHENGRGARYTKIRKPKKIVYIEECSSRKNAMKREQEIKTMTHNQKKTLADNEDENQPSSNDI